MLVMALEDYDEVTGTADKAAIMMPGRGRAEPRRSRAVGSAEEGLLVSLDRKGEVDLPFIASLYGEARGARWSRSWETSSTETPTTRRWQTADDVPLGERPARSSPSPSGRGRSTPGTPRPCGPSSPRTCSPATSTPTSGHPGFPTGDVRAFAAELFGVPLASIASATSRRTPSGASRPTTHAERSVAATADFGTARANGTTLLELALNLRTPVDLRHRRPRRPRGAGREPGGDARRAGEAGAHQGAVQAVGLLRPRADRAAGAHLQRHLQQPPAPGLRRLAPRLPRHEPGHHAPPAPGGRRLAGDERREHAPGPRRRGREDLHDGRHRHEAAAGGAREEADDTSVPNHMLEQFAREFLQLYPNARLLVAGQGRPGEGPAEAAHREDRERRVGRRSSSPNSGFERIGDVAGTTRRGSSASRSPSTTALLVDRAGIDSRPPEHHQDASRSRRRAARSGSRTLLAEDKKDDGLVFDELGRRPPLRRRGPLLQEPRDADQDGAGRGHPDGRVASGRSTSS